METVKNRILNLPSEFYKWSFYLMLLVISIGGFFKGVLNETGSRDVQYYPAKLFSENIDFYNYFFEYSNDWFLSQAPNYYFQLYYLLQPLTIFSWGTFKYIWFAISLLLLLFFVFQVKKRFELDFKDLSILIFPFFIGFPLTTTFGNGQFGIIVIAFTYLAWIYRENKILLPILLSILSIKYSFGAPIIIGFFIMGYYRSVIISGIITLIFPIIYSIKFNLDTISTIFLPFKVSSKATSIGQFDIMSLYRIFYDTPLVGINVLTIGLAIFILGFYYIARKYSLDKKTIFLCSLLFSLFGFFHLGYDYVLFLLIIPFVLKTKYFKIVYIYLLLFCLAPRIISVLAYLFDSPINYRDLLRTKYYIIYNIFCLGGYSFYLIREGIMNKNTAQIELNNSLSPL